MTQSREHTLGELALPRPPGVLRRQLAAHPRAVDWAIVVTYLFGCALMLFIDVIGAVSMEMLIEIDPDAAEVMRERYSLLASPWLVLVLLSTVLVAVALRLRRKYPLAGVAVLSVIMFFELGLLVVPNSVALAFLLYAVPVYRGVREAWLAYAVATVSSGVLAWLTYGGGGLITPVGVMLAEGPTQFADVVIVIVMNSLWLLVVLMIGINFGNRKRYVEALIDRAYQLAREREQRAQLAAATERARIAREMHDIVAHSLSVVVTLSEAASVAIDTQPAAAKSASERAAETGRRALVEMRRLLGVLGERSETAAEVEPPAATDTAREPLPGISQLSQLIQGFRDAGLRLEVIEEGVPGSDSGHGLAIYRIVQEALTNALRYAGTNAQVSLTLEHLPNESRIEVVDGGRVSEVSRDDQPEQRSTLPGSGRGLKGAEERARLYGGTLEAGPLGRGWRVRAVVPTAVDLNAGHASQDERENE